MDCLDNARISMGWDSITRTDVAGNLLALIRHMGGPAVIVGHSISGGAATIAAAKEPGRCLVYLVRLAAPSRRDVSGIAGFVLFGSWTVALVDEEYLGRLAIRHRLTPRLRTLGGHIGYDIRPSARQRGHATAMLAAARRY